MSQSVNVNFRMDAQLKRNVEEICQRMGMNLTTALTICCKKIEQERRIPFVFGGRTNCPVYDILSF